VETYHARKPRAPRPTIEPPPEREIGFRGVCRNKDRWSARITRDGKHVHLGTYDTKEDAARAYDEAARRLHGEFARFNFPREGERSALHD